MSTGARNLFWIEGITLMRTFLIAVFYLIVTPVALLMRVVFRRDQLHRAFNPRAVTYRRQCRPRNARHLFRQY
jgi:hypothetical protein